VYQLNPTFIFNTSGLLRRFAPRNDGHRERSEAIQNKFNNDTIAVES